MVAKDETNDMFMVCCSLCEEGELRQHLAERKRAIAEKADRFGVELAAVVANVEGLLRGGQLSVTVEQIGPAAALTESTQQGPAPVEAAALTGGPGSAGSRQVAVEQRRQAVGWSCGQEFGQQIQAQFDIKQLPVREPMGRAMAERGRPRHRGGGWAESGHWLRTLCLSHELLGECPVQRFTPVYVIFLRCSIFLKNFFGRFGLPKIKDSCL